MKCKVAYYLNVKSVGKFLLPLIFVGYFVSNNFFYHSHIVDGVKIVHSHPFQKDAQGNPLHDHNAQEIHLVQALSSFVSEASVVFFILLSVPFVYKSIRPYIGSENFVFSVINGRLFSRPPPCL